MSFDLIIISHFWKSRNKKVSVKFNQMEGESYNWASGKDIRWYESILKEKDWIFSIRYL